MARRTAARDSAKSTTGTAPSPNGRPGDDAQRLAGLSLDAEFLRTLIEESGRCFFVIDPITHQLVYISPGFDRIWGRSRDEFYREPTMWYSTIHDDDVDRCRREAAKRMDDPSVSHPPFEYRIRRPDGAEVWIRGNVFQSRHAATGETLLCGIAEDITAAKKNEAERDAEHSALEEDVAISTRELTAANEALRREIVRRVEVERELLEKQSYMERMLRFQEWDRSLMSLEIHDGAIQNAVGALLHLDSVAAAPLSEKQRQKLTLCGDLLQAAIAESRRVIGGMRPQTLDDLGLRAALEELALLNEQQGLAVELQFDYVPLGKAPMVDTTIYRLVQESLTNVRIHAHTDRAKVEVRREGTQVHLTISDAGRGFDTTIGIEGIGLHGLRQRARAVGGEVNIASSPGRGTVISARVPALDPADSAAHERDRAAAALAVSRVRFQQILDATSAVIFVKDFEGRYELINRRFESLFHVTRDQFIGRTDYDVHTQEVAEAVRENDRRTLQERRSITFEESVPSNGEMREYVTVKFPIPGDAGGPPSLCGIATDITEQKRQLRALEEARNRFQAFMDHSPLLAWIKNAAGRYVFMNQRMIETFRLDEDAIIGRTDADLFPPEVAKAAREQDQLVLADGVTRNFQQHHATPTSSKLVWDTCKFRMRADDGSWLVGGVALDATTGLKQPK